MRLPAVRVPPPGGELEARKGDVEIGREYFEMLAGGETGLEAAAQTQRGKYGNSGEARTYGLSRS